MISLEVSFSRLTALRASTFLGRPAYRRHDVALVLESSIGSGLSGLAGMRPLSSGRPAGAQPPK